MDRSRVSESGGQGSPRSGDVNANVHGDGNNGTQDRYEFFPFQHPTDPLQLASHYLLASTHYADWHMKEAIKHIGIFAQISKAVIGEGQPDDRPASQHKPAGASQAEGRGKDAVEPPEDDVEIHKATLDEPHPRHLSPQHALAIANQAEERIKEAIELVGQLIPVPKTTLDEGNPNRLASQGILASLDGEDGPGSTSLNCHNATSIAEHDADAREDATNSSSRDYASSVVALSEDSDASYKEPEEGEEEDDDNDIHDGGNTMSLPSFCGSIDLEPAFESEYEFFEGHEGPSEHEEAAREEERRREMRRQEWLKYCPKYRGRPIWTFETWVSTDTVFTKTGTKPIRNQIMAKIKRILIGNQRDMPDARTRLCDEVTRAVARRRKPQTQPTRLYNFKTGRVEMAIPKGKYAIVSYVWSQVSIQEVLRLLTPLMQACGLVHLWADQLCIYQDSQEDKENEIPRMAQYYSNACVTWAITGTDDWAHPGCITDMRPGNRDAGRLDTRQIRSSQWYQRVWTLQEGALSNNLSYVSLSGKTINARLLAGLDIDYPRGFTRRHVIQHMYQVWQKSFLEMTNNDGSSGGPDYVDDVPLSSLGYAPPPWRPMWMHFSAWSKEERVGIEQRKFGEVLADARGRKCTNVLDEVFGLLALSNDAGQVRPNYGQSRHELWANLVILGVIGHSVLHGYSTHKGENEMEGGGWLGEPIRERYTGQALAQVNKDNYLLALQARFDDNYMTMIVRAAQGRIYKRGGDYWVANEVEKVIARVEGDTLHGLGDLHVSEEPVLVLLPSSVSAGLTTLLEGRQTGPHRWRNTCGHALTLTSVRERFFEEWKVA